MQFKADLRFYLLQTVLWDVQQIQHIHQTEPNFLGQQPQHSFTVSYNHKAFYVKQNLLLWLTTHQFLDNYILLSTTPAFQKNYLILVFTRPKFYIKQDQSLQSITTLMLFSTTTLILWLITRLFFDDFLFSPRLT